jgi:hypothetical protein
VSDPAVTIPDSVWKPPVRRAKVLAQLAETQRCSKEQIDEAAKRLKIGRAMVYRPLARFRVSEQASSSLPTRPGRKPGAKELGVDQERVVDRLIHEFQLSRQKPTVAALHRTIAWSVFKRKYRFLPIQRSEVGSPLSMSRKWFEPEKVPKRPITSFAR